MALVVLLKITVQLPQRSSVPSFRPYVSPFSLYPSLVSVSPQSADPPVVFHQSLLSSGRNKHSFLEQIQRLDLGPLRQSLVASTITDSQRHFCAYEFADGTCRDSSCRDVHFRDVDPSGLFLFLHPVPTSLISFPLDHFVASR